MEIIRLDERNFKDAVKAAVGVLKKGGMVVFPTDTLYGIAVDAGNRTAIERVRQLKGREKKKPISIIVPDVEDIVAHAELPMHAKWYADRFLPGALTLILEGKKHIPGELMLNGQVGVRVPDDSFSRELARALGAPITATSANRAGFPTPASADDIIPHFGNIAHEIDLIIDAGPRAGGLGSTVVTFIEGEPYVIREGALSKQDLGL